MTESVAIETFMRTTITKCIIPSEPYLYSPSNPASHSLISTLATHRSNHLYFILLLSHLTSLTVTDKIFVFLLTVV